MPSAPLRRRLLVGAAASGALVLGAADAGSQAVKAAKLPVGIKVVER